MLVDKWLWELIKDLGQVWAMEIQGHFHNSYVVSRAAGEASLLTEGGNEQVY